MKKFLLTIMAAVVCALASSAQIYVTTGTPKAEAGWEGWNLLGEPTTISVYDSYVIVDKWLGTEGEDLRVDFDEEGEITDMSLITDGVAAEATADDAYFYVYPQSKYCVMFYKSFCSVVTNAPVDDEDGNYVFLCSYIYETAESNFESGYFQWAWNPVVEEVAELYTVETSTSVDETWSSSGFNALLIDKPVSVTVYEDNSMIVAGWTGSDKDYLYIEFDDEENITLLSLLDNELNTLASTTSGYVEAAINNSLYYYVQAYVGDGLSYAYANAEEGYLIFTGYFYKSQTEYDYLYYNLEWTYDPDGIKAVEVTEFDGNATYFDLNGVRVDNPTAPGIYIKYIDGKATKTLIK